LIGIELLRLSLSVVRTTYTAVPLPINASFDKLSGG